MRGRAATGRTQAASELAACDPDREANAAVLATVLSGDGSSKAARVELGGIEPPSAERSAIALRPSPRTRLLRLPYRRVGGPR